MPAPAVPPFEPGEVLAGAGAIGRFIGLADHQVINLVKAGRLPAWKLGRKIYARRSVLIAFIAAQEARALAELASRQEADFAASGHVGRVGNSV